MGACAGKAAVAAASAQLRHRAIQDGYRGHRNPEPAFGLASILDRLEVGYRDLPGDVQAGVVEACAVLAEPPAGERDS